MSLRRHAVARGDRRSLDRCGNRHAGSEKCRLTSRAAAQWRATPRRATRRRSRRRNSPGSARSSSTNSGVGPDRPQQHRNAGVQRQPRDRRRRGLCRGVRPPRQAGQHRHHLMARRGDQPVQRRQSRLRDCRRTRSISARSSRGSRAPVRTRSSPHAGPYRRRTSTDRAAQPVHRRRRVVVVLPGEGQLILGVGEGSR